LRSLCTLCNLGLVSNWWLSCLRHPSAGITGLCHCTCLLPFENLINIKNYLFRKIEVYNHIIYSVGLSVFATYSENTLGNSDIVLVTFKTNRKLARMTRRKGHVNSQGKVVSLLAWDLTVPIFKCCSNVLALRILLHI
jgi:hypothetical protein